MIEIIDCCDDMNRDETWVGLENRSEPETNSMENMGRSIFRGLHMGGGVRKQPRHRDVEGQNRVLQDRTLHREHVQRGIRSQKQPTLRLRFRQQHRPSLLPIHPAERFRHHHNRHEPNPLSPPPRHVDSGGQSLDHLPVAADRQLRRVQHVRTQRKVRDRGVADLPVPGWVRAEMVAAVERDGLERRVRAE